MSLQDLIGLLQVKNYLGAFVLITLLLRKYTSDTSKFPVTIPPNWRQVVTAFAGLAYGVLNQRLAGQNWGFAILSGLSVAGTSGFFDGLLNAVFDHDTAPQWAKALVFVGNDVTTKKATDDVSAPAVAADAEKKS